MQSRPLIALFALLSLAAVSCRSTVDKNRVVPGPGAAQQPGPEDVDPEAMMAAMAEKAAPTEAHRFLQNLVGDWSMTMKMRMAPDAPWENVAAESSYRSVLGGRYVIEEMKMEMMGMPMEGMNILGYDKLTDRYTSHWRDTMSTWVVSSSGVADASGKRISYEGTMKDVVTPDGRPYRMEFEMTGDDSFTLKMFDRIGEADVQVMEVAGMRK